MFIDYDAKHGRHTTCIFNSPIKLFIPIENSAKPVNLARVSTKVRQDGQTQINIYTVYALCDVRTRVGNSRSSMKLLAGSNEILTSPTQF